MAGSYIQVHWNLPSRASNQLGCFSFPPSFFEPFHRDIFTYYEFRQKYSKSAYAYNAYIDVICMFKDTQKGVDVGIFYCITRRRIGHAILYVM